MASSTIPYSSTIRLANKRGLRQGRLEAVCIIEFNRSKVVLMTRYLTLWNKKSDIMLKILFVKRNPGDVFSKETVVIIHRGWTGSWMRDIKNWNEVPCYLNVLRYSYS